MFGSCKIVMLLFGLLLLSSAPSYARRICDNSSIDGHDGHWYWHVAAGDVSISSREYDWFAQFVMDGKSMPGRKGLSWHFNLDFTPAEWGMRPNSLGENSVVYLYRDDQLVAAPYGAADDPELPLTVYIADDDMPISRLVVKNGGRTIVDITVPAPDEWAMARDHLLAGNLALLEHNKQTRCRVSSYGTWTPEGIVWR